MSDESLVLVERDEARRVALVRLNRPKQLNALNGPTMDALCEALEKLDRDEAVRVIVVTGSERAFAAGADIGEMSGASPIDMLRTNRIAQWDRVRKITKPVIAAGFRFRRYQASLQRPLGAVSIATSRASSSMTDIS